LVPEHHRGRECGAAHRQGFDQATVGTDGNAQLSGNVVVKQGDREIRANDVQ